MDADNNVNVEIEIIVGIFWIVRIFSISCCRWWIFWIFSLAGGGCLSISLLQVVGPAVTDDAEEDEESMDWWTKYFASIDTMIEVSLI